MIMDFSHDHVLEFHDLKTCVSTTSYHLSVFFGTQVVV